MGGFYKSLTIGSTKLWLPSRKSVASHLGGLSMTLLGHVLFSSFNGGNLLYFLEGSASLYFIVSNCVQIDKL